MAVLEPFLKWAGGKRWLIHRYRHLFPDRCKLYIEPFLGSGAVFFHLCPRRALLGDANAELVNAYQHVRKSPERIARWLHRYQKRHCEEFYYERRSKVPRSPFERAVRFLYLNRTCWNGLYRVNRLGEFNVPIGTKTVVEYQEEFLKKVSDALATAQIVTADFESIIDRAGRGDLVYVDPPYTVAHNSNNFIKYNASLFSWDDQVRLCRVVRRAALRGASVVVSNADHESIRFLYAGFGVHHRVERASVLSGSPSHRRKTTEILITK